MAWLVAAPRGLAVIARLGCAWPVTLWHVIARRGLVGHRMSWFGCHGKARLVAASPVKFCLGRARLVHARLSRYVPAVLCLSARVAVCHGADLLGGLGLAVTSRPGRSMFVPARHVAVRQGVSRRGCHGKARLV